MTSCPTFVFSEMEISWQADSNPKEGLFDRHGAKQSFAAAMHNLPKTSAAATRPPLQHS